MAAYDLDTVSSVLKMHPRTVLKIVEHVGKAWHRSYNPSIDLFDLELVFGGKFNEKIFIRCLKGKDEFLTLPEMAALFAMPVRTIGSRAYPTIINYPYNVRYLKSQVMERHVARYSDPSRRSDGKKPNKSKNK
jgi:hypothetical protein